jgi:hyperosmotically inducible protein
VFIQAAIAAFVVALAPGAAWAAPPERPDAQIFKDVAAKVTNYSRFTVFDDIRGSMDHGVLTLSGKVTMPFKRDDLARLAAHVPGVTRVVNKIEVLPVSMFDDQLRYQIAHAIYDNPSFWHYASMVNPPIHIVVEHGRVTLTGVVNNDVERMLARSLASGFMAFSVTSELRTDKEAKVELEYVVK